MKFKAKSEDTRNFIKLKSGESVTGVFRGDPYEFRIHWLTDESRATLCSQKKDCELCKIKKSSFRFRVNFIVQEGGQFVAKVLEQGWTSYQALMNLQESGYNLEKQIIQISRQGSGLTTTYSIIPSPKGMVTPTQEKAINEVKVNELGHITEAETEPEPIEMHLPLHSRDEEIPF